MVNIDTRCMLIISNGNNIDKPGEVGCKVFAPRVHGLLVELWVLHHCAALHILLSTAAGVNPQGSVLKDRGPVAHSGVNNVRCCPKDVT